MRVLVIGGYGLIGAYVVARLTANGDEVLGAGRQIDTAARRFPNIRWVKADLGKMSADQWAGLLVGQDAVVNCAGALQDSPKDNLAAVHVTGLVALAEACRRAGVARLIHISAAGMSPEGGAFGRTKLEAEAALAGIDLDWTILRPGLVLAPAAFGGSALLRGLAAFPGLIPAIYADREIQVAAAQDVAEAVSRSLSPDAPRRMTVDLVSDRAASLRDLLQSMRAWLGLRPATMVSAPPALAHVSGVVSDALAWLGWRSPMRTTAITQLSLGVRGESGAAERLLGVRMRTLDEILAAWPSGVQERWFAKLYFVKPLTLVTLSLFWISSGLIGLAETPRAASVLARTSLSPEAAIVAIRLGAITDLVLGLAICHRRLAPWALQGMLAVTVAYLAGATIWRPDLWADPLAPLIKTLPAAVLALTALATMDER